MQNYKTLDSHSVCEKARQCVHYLTRLYVEKYCHGVSQEQNY